MAAAGLAVLWVFLQRLHQQLQLPEGWLTPWPAAAAGGVVPCSPVS
jgi:hypothetical protein